jgi:hypothetical protein
MPPSKAEGTSSIPQPAADSIPPSQATHDNNDVSKTDGSDKSAKKSRDQGEEPAPAAAAVAAVAAVAPPGPAPALAPEVAPVVAPAEAEAPTAATAAAALMDAPAFFSPYSYITSKQQEDALFATAPSCYCSKAGCWLRWADFDIEQELLNEEAARWAAEAAHGL